MTVTEEAIPQPTALPLSFPVKEKVVFVDRDKFCDLLVSRKRLVRSDSHEENVRGLSDLDRNIRYVIREEELN